MVDEGFDVEIDGVEKMMEMPDQHFGVNFDLYV